MSMPVGVKFWTLTFGPFAYSYDESLLLSPSLGLSFYIEGHALSQM